MKVAGSGLHFKRIILAAVWQSWSRSFGGLCTLPMEGEGLFRLGRSESDGDWLGSIGNAFIFKGELTEPTNPSYLKKVKDKSGMVVSRFLSEHLHESW